MFKSWLCSHLRYLSLTCMLLMLNVFTFVMRTGLTLTGLQGFFKFSFSKVIQILEKNHSNQGVSVSEILVRKHREMNRKKKKKGYWINKRIGTWVGRGNSWQNQERKPSIMEMLCCWSLKQESPSLNSPMPVLCTCISLPLSIPPHTVFCHAPKVVLMHPGSWEVPSPQDYWLHKMFHIFFLFCMPPHTGIIT